MGIGCIGRCQSRGSKTLYGNFKDYKSGKVFSVHFLALFLSSDSIYLIKNINCFSTSFLFQVTWHGPNIVVFSDVTIKPPYKAEDVNGNPDSRQLKYVKKIVEKFLSDQADLDDAVSTT